MQGSTIPVNAGGAAQVQDASGLVTGGVTDGMQGEISITRSQKSSLELVSPAVG
ncbi:hypothetical protein A2U01_0086396, partial [Trifolium medium]|nr:hypothetical protein [Trifolium medium]